MSLDALDTRITNDRDKAQQLNAGALAEYARIRANATLSTEGKRNAIARVYLDVKPKVTALQDDEAKAIAETRTSLTRALFGTANTDPANLIAYRDAQDRAGRLDTEQDALTLMNRALLNQDTTLAAAVLEVSLNQFWPQPVDAYSNANPDQAQRLADLTTLGRLNSAQAKLNAVFAYHTHTPDELAGASTEMLQRLAAVGAWQ